MGTTTHDVQDNLFGLARGFHDEGDEVAPVAFFLRGEEPVAIALLRIPKPQWRKRILGEIAAHEADGVILQCEARLARGTLAATALAAYAAGADSLEGVVGVEDALISTMETAAGTYRSLTTLVQPDGSLGETLVIEEAGVRDGALTGFFSHTDVARV